MNIVIDGNEIKSEAEFHAALAQKLSLSAYYGRNLDALWDALSANTERPICLIWKNSGASAEALGAAFSQIIDVLKRVREQDEAWGLAEVFEFRLE